MKKLFQIAIIILLALPGMIKSQGYDSLYINNINARFNAFGNHFCDFDSYQNHYFFPKDSASQTIYNSSFWLGGLNENNYLKIAAEMYRQGGKDFHTGPLSFNNDSAWINPKTVEDYYKVWKLNKTDIEYHVLHWAEPEYEPIDHILNWPAHGDETLHQSYYLAPFVDLNNNGDYEPMQGDYPLIRGDQLLFFIFNDQLDHSETSGGTIGIEIHGFAYAFNTPNNPSLNNTTFLSYKIFNRSQQTITNAYAGVLTDIDLGNAGDDFVGCDIKRGTHYAYNGTEIDGNGEPNSFGEYPPAQGVVILGGPYLGEDGIDNPYGECNVSINGVGFGDGVEDNERYGMNHFMHYNNWSGPTGNPVFPGHYYNYMEGFWNDGTSILYGGTGHVDGGAFGPEANFMFPGLTDPCNWGTGGVIPSGPADWSEISAGNEPGDRRGLCSMGPFTLKSGGFHKIDMAFVTGQGNNNMHSVEVLMEAIDSIRSYYFEEPDNFGYVWMGTDENLISKQGLTIFPNPAMDQIQIQYKPESNEAFYFIYNSFGREVKSGVLNRQTNLQSVSLENLAKGLYIIKVNDNLQTFSNKLLIK